MRVQLGRGEGSRFGQTHYEVPSLLHQELSQRTLVEVAGGAVSVSVNGAVTEGGASSPMLRGVPAVGARAPGGSFSLLGPKAIDKCVPS